MTESYADWGPAVDPSNSASSYPEMDSSSSRATSQQPSFSNNPPSYANGYSYGPAASSPSHGPGPSSHPQTQHAPPPPSTWALMDWSAYARSSSPMAASASSSSNARPGFNEQASGLAHPHYNYPHQQHIQQQPTPYAQSRTSPASSSTSSRSFGPPPLSAASSSSSSAAAAGRGGHPMDPPLLPSGAAYTPHLPSVYSPAVPSSPYGHSSSTDGANFGSYQHQHQQAFNHHQPSSPTAQSGWSSGFQNHGGFGQQLHQPQMPQRARSDPTDAPLAQQSPSLSRPSGPPASASAPPQTPSTSYGEGAPPSFYAPAYDGRAGPHAQHDAYSQYRTSTAAPLGSHASATAGDESDSSYTAIDIPSSTTTMTAAAGAGAAAAPRGSVRRGASRTRIATTQKTAPDDDEKQARRREQNRTAQRAYKARQNKHVEEVEIRNKELELEVRQQRDLLINMRDLLMRCQQENDVLRRVLKPLDPPDNERSLPLDTSPAHTPRPPTPAGARDGLQEIIDAHAIVPALPPSERRIPDDSRRRADEERHLARLRERYESYRVRIAASCDGSSWGALSSSGRPMMTDSSVALAPQLKVEHADSVSPPFRSPLASDVADGSRTSSATDGESWMPTAVDDSPIDEDNLQGLLGPRYWNHGTQLLPPPPRVPLRGIWREIKAAAPDVCKDDIDIDLLCTSLRRSTFCDGIEPCIPKPAFSYIVEHVVQQSRQSISAQPRPSAEAAGSKAGQSSPQPPSVCALGR